MRPGSRWTRRETVTRLLTGQPLPENGGDVVPSALWKERRACFVSIKQKDGELRGCIGTILPTRRSIAEEIMENAVSASVRDPRFSPVRTEELDRLEISVDVLTEPERIDSRKELDVRRYGVIVSSGHKRGLLLPDLDGVDTVDEQISIAMRKGGITSRDAVTLERFEVIRHH